MKEQVEKVKQQNPGMSLKEAAKQYEQIHQGYLVQNLREYAIVLYVDLLRLAVFAKDPSFEEEQEWRFVLPVEIMGKLQTYSRCFRTGRNTLIPYLEAKLSTSDDASYFPLTDVILGPGSDPENAIEAARSFLNEHELTIQPSLSHVPYRSS